jgi:hypothetical protein
VDDDVQLPRPGQPGAVPGQPGGVPGQPPAVIRLPQGRVAPGVEDQDPPVAVPVPEQNMPGSPVRANPFGVTSGATRPGTISPVTRPRNPNEPPQQER